MSSNQTLTGKKTRPMDSSELTRLRRIAAANLPAQDILLAPPKKEMPFESQQVADFRLYRVVMKSVRAAVPNLS
jgi:hypothetical protein